MFRRNMGKDKHDQIQAELILNELKDGIYYLRIKPEADLLYANPAFKKLLGHDLKSLFARHGGVEQISHPDDRERISMWFKGELSMAEPFVARYVNSRGNILWLEDCARPICDEDGQTVGMMGTVRNVTDRMEKEEIRRFLNHRDSQTGLRNRNRYEKRIKELNSRSDCAIGLILLDMDNLKRINDTMGHKSGDELIRRVGGFISKRLSTNMTAYRIGGDEFIILMEGASQEAVDQWSMKLRHDLEHHNAQHALKMELSMGTAFASSTKGRMIELFEAADERMYADKNNRRTKRIGEKPASG